jgi:hypothetical protein
MQSPADDIIGDTLLSQDKRDSCRGAPVSKYQRSPVVRLEQGHKTFFKPDIVCIISFKKPFFDTDAIAGIKALGNMPGGIQEWHHCPLIRNSNGKPTQVRVPLDQREKIINGWDGKILEPAIV